MSVQLRIARPVSDLARAVARYCAGLGLEELANFRDHDGFDGTMLGLREAHFHFEFTCCRDHPVVPAPTPEDLLVFYVPQLQAWLQRCQAMRDAGFKEVPPFNPYWQRQGRTFEDEDGYRVVIQQAAWNNDPGTKIA
jgi:catechol 2,3-dioxygenase-like lactoylglutathione lyase family enzyme